MNIQGHLVMGKERTIFSYACFVAITIISVHPSIVQPGRAILNHLLVCLIIFCLVHVFLISRITGTFIPGLGEFV